MRNAKWLLLLALTVSAAAQINNGGGGGGGVTSENWNGSGATTGAITVNPGSGVSVTGSNPFTIAGLAATAGQVGEVQLTADLCGSSTAPNVCALHLLDATTLTFSTATGANPMLKLIDGTSNTGTGAVFNAATATGSLAFPFQISQGVAAAGNASPNFLQAVGAVGGANTGVTSAGFQGGGATITTGAGSASGATSGTGGPGGDVLYTIGAGGNAGNAGALNGRAGNFQVTLSPPGTGGTAATTGGQFIIKSPSTLVANPFDLQNSAATSQIFVDKNFIVNVQGTIQSAIATTFQSTTNQVNIKSSSVSGNGNVALSAGGSGVITANHALVFTTAAAQQGTAISILNSSGSTIATGAPVKISSAADDLVVVTATTDTTNILGINEGSCTTATNCTIVRTGMIIDGQVDAGTTCNTTRGNFVINSTVTAGKLACTATFTAGTVIGYQTNLQAANGTALHVVLLPK